MRILIADDVVQQQAVAENAIRERGAVMPIERLYLFGGWRLEETARDLVGPGGRRVDLTSSEFDLLLAFVRQPGRALSRDALLGTLEGASGLISIVRSIRWWRGCARSWPAAPTGPRSFARCAASAIFSAPPSPGLAREGNPPPLDAARPAPPRLTHREGGCYPCATLAFNLLYLNEIKRHSCRR